MVENWILQFIGYPKILTQNYRQVRPQQPLRISGQLTFKLTPNLDETVDVVEGPGRALTRGLSWPTGQHYANNSSAQFVTKNKVKK